MHQEQVGTGAAWLCRFRFHVGRHQDDSQRPSAVVVQCLSGATLTSAAHQNERPADTNLCYLFSWRMVYLHLPRIANTWKCVPALFD